MGTEQGKVEIGNGLDLKHLFPGQTFLSAWNTPEAFARHIEKMDQNKAWCQDSWTETNERFYGCKSMDEALRLAKEGWVEGAWRVEKLRGRVLAASPIIKRPAQYGIVGAVPSVPRAVAGNPMNMRILGSSVSRRRPVITLISNMSNNCSITAESICNYAAVVCALIDHIEAAGFATEVISIAPTTGRKGYTALNAIKAKESTHPVDLKRLSFALGHVALFRRMVFADWYFDYSNKSGLGSCLGQAGVISSEGFAEKMMFLLPPVGKNTKVFKTEDSAATEGIQYLIEQLKRQGCPAFPLTREEKERMLAEPLEYVIKEPFEYHDKDDDY